MSEMTGHDRIKNDNIMDSLGVVLPTKKMKVPGWDYSCMLWGDVAKAVKRYHEHEWRRERRLDMWISSLWV